MAVAKAQVDLIARDKVSGVAANVERVLLRMQAKMQAVAQAAQRMLMVGAAAVGGMVYASIKQSEAEQTLESVLKATGNAAGYTSTQLKQMASDLQLVTAFGDETTLAAMAMLATFKEVKGDMFKETMEMAMDLSVVMKTDLKASILMLGKALNDPAERMTALTRAGVSFTQQQIEQTKALQASGDMLGAQTLLMGALRTQFGGAARGEIKQAGGMLKQLKNEVGDLVEKMGQLLMPTIMSFLETVRNVVVMLVNWVSANSKIVIGVVKTVTQIGVLMVVLPRLIGMLAMIVGVFKHMRTAMIWVFALGGPKAWATLAAGMAIALIAIKATRSAYGSLADEIRKVGNEAEAAAKKEKKAAEDRLGKTGPDVSGIKTMQDAAEANWARARKNKALRDVETMEFKEEEKLLKKQIAFAAKRATTSPIGSTEQEEAGRALTVAIRKLDELRRRHREDAAERLAENQMYWDAAAAAEKRLEEDREKNAQNDIKRTQELLDKQDSWIKKLKQEALLVGKTADEVERMKRAWEGATEAQLAAGKLLQDAISRDEDRIEKEKRLTQEAEAILAGRDKKEELVASRFEGLTQAWKRIQASTMRSEEATVQEKQLKAVEEAAVRLKEGDKKAHKKLDEVKDAIEDAMGGPAIFGP